MRVGFLTTVVGVCLAVAGCGKNSEQKARPSGASKAPLVEMTLQSGATLRGLQLHFVNHEDNWKITSDPIRVRISETETKDLARETLRGVRVKEVERDERGDVKRLQVVYATDEGEISGWSFPSGVFAFQLHVSPEKPLSTSELTRLFIKESGFHVNHEVREVGGLQFIRIPLTQIKSLTLPNGAVGDGLGGSH